jgi:hypothetical protein
VDLGCTLGLGVSIGPRGREVVRRSADVTMDLLIYIVVFGALATGLIVLGGTYGRSGPTGLLRGMFSSPTLGWPVGVQEEDRDRIWSWDQLPTEPDDADLIDLGDARIESSPVHRVHRPSGASEPRDWIA